MTQQDLIDLVDPLRAETAEREWLEFKKNRYEPQELGEYDPRGCQPTRQS